ncbi:MAG: hypothetical protein KGI98_06070 [Euryarchaeota archaeon]|nr:hypothetical protein [Euryarchaeota archaeon]MDE1879141.1 hypothetical protein [Euryarchaeota archaeon]MDE2044261.1 hypothetical protein [Thermoplasmata archaeon]
MSVVWCRQVDNEAESPGYTTVPTEFPGRKETLDLVRVVGNLAINAADTHDYWDPDPSTKLAYYNNLFLYPAHGGRYLCLGRMFLSTEDRPRLGMKTLVLDTSSLLASENLGQALRRWYASMGNPGRVAPPSGKVDPQLVEVLSEGFTYLRGDPTTPLLGFVSDIFESAVEAVFSLLERVPMSVAGRSGILIFPYFLPVGRVNFPEFAEKFPLTLGLARIPRNEAGGDRHQKRLAGWAGQPVRMIDLTQGVPSDPAGALTPPAPVAWWCSGEKSELASDLRKGVDAVELPRLREPAKSDEETSGSAHRRELARLGEVMVTLAGALERPAEERRELDAETSSKVGAYLTAIGPVAPVPETGVLSSSFAPAAKASGALASGPVAGSTETAEPPWRRTPRLRSERSEVVPGPRVGPGGAVPPGVESPPAAAPVAPVGTSPAAGSALVSQASAAPPQFADVLRLSPTLLEELRAYIDGRIGEVKTRTGDLDPDVVGRLERDLERRLEAKANLLVSPEALEARVVEVLSRRPPPPPPDPRSLLTDEVKASLADVVNSLVAQRLTESSAQKVPKAPPEVTLAKVDDRVLELLSGQTGERRAAVLMEQKIQRYVSASVEADRRSTDDRLDKLLKELQSRAKAQTELEATIRAEVRFLDEKLQTLMGRMIPLLKRTWLKIDELDKRPAGSGGASEAKMKRLRDELWSEMKRLELDLSERTRLILDRVEGNIQNQGRLWLTLVTQLSSLTEQRRELERIVQESKEDIESSSSPEASPEVEVEGGETSTKGAREEEPPRKGPRGLPASESRHSTRATRTDGPSAGTEG